MGDTTSSEASANKDLAVSSRARSGAISRPHRAWLTPLALAIVTALALAPFTGKAFHIDDPVFMWTAQRILEHPLDFYGFDVNWYGSAEPMSQTMQNPPLASYYAAIIGGVFGFGERALHAGFLVPAVLCVVGTWRLARRLALRPVLAALVALATPALFVSATSVMCDVTMTCLFVWAMVLWIEGLDAGRALKLLTASVLVLAASLAKYFAIALIPLLFVYTFARGRAHRRQALWLFVPVALLATYQVWTARMYGEGLITHAAHYARSQHDVGAGPKHLSLLVGLTFTGGCMLPALFFAPRTCSLRALACCAAVGAAIAIFVATQGTRPFPGMTPRDVGWAIAAQVGLFAAVGASVLWLCAADWLEQRDADSLLLACWIGGTLVFACFVNWSVNARSVLPMAPAVGVLVARRWDARSASASKRSSSWLACIALVPAFFVSASLAQADAELAESARNAAREIRERYAHELPNVWFEGHWGFQFYMQAWGAQPLDYRSFHLKLRDVLVIPHNSTNVKPLPKKTWEEVEIRDHTLRSRFATVNSEALAGFYASNFGILPFAFGATATDRYDVLRIVQPVAARR